MYRGAQKLFGLQLIGRTLQPSVEVHRLGSDQIDVAQRLGQAGRLGHAGGAAVAHELERLTGALFG